MIRQGGSPAEPPGSNHPLRHLGGFHDAHKWDGSELLLNSLQLDQVVVPRTWRLQQRLSHGFRPVSPLFRIRTSPTLMEAIARLIGPNSMYIRTSPAT